MKNIKAADLFCGAGGTSTGLYRAADRLGRNVDLLALNHWPIAIATHTANHKEAVHLCHGLDGVDPRKVIKGGKLDLLVASPECTHHSNARGGRPMNDQSRASAWHVIRWLEALDVKVLLVENVREFASWGPLGRDGRPMKSRKGETFQAWLQAVRSLGYVVDHKILNAADYGDPTTRHRLFVMARKGKRSVIWPTPSHSKLGGKDLTGTTKKWRAAREIINWDDRGTSIFNRKTPLKPNTMRRIAAGLNKFSGIDLEDFLVKLYGTSGAASIHQPLPTVTGGGNHLALIQPYLLGQQSGSAPRSTNDPVPTVSGKGAIAKVEPFITAHFGEREEQAPRVHSIDSPAPTATPRGAGNICIPFISEYHQDKDGKPRIKSVDDPLPTQTTEPRFGLAQPYMMSAGGPECAPRSTEDPAHTVLTRDHIAIVRPFIVPQNSSNGPRDVNRPVPTLTTTSRGVGIAQPFISGAGGPRGSGKPQSVEVPLGTVLAENHRALVEPFTVALTHGAKPGEDQSSRARSVDEPMQTVTGAHRGEIAVIQIELVQYTDETRKNAQNCLLLTFSDGTKWLLDIFFRMFRYRELARANSFPDSYIFTGNTSDIVKQIGNAVPTGMSEALCMSALGPA